MTSNIRDVQINRVHSGAICQEIGDRIRISLGGGSDLPPGLRTLINRLAKAESGSA